MGRKKTGLIYAKKIMLTHFESFFLYLQHLRAKSLFCKNFFEVFQKWTFLKCPISKIDPVLFF